MCIFNYLLYLAYPKQKRNAKRGGNGRTSNCKWPLQHHTIDVKFLLGFPILTDIIHFAAFHNNINIYLTTRHKAAKLTAFLT